MSDPLIYAKTAAGHEELKLRERNLGGTARRLLLFVNGERDRPALSRLFSGRIDLDSELAGLERAGLIGDRSVRAKAVPAQAMTPEATGAAPGLIRRLLGLGGTSTVIDPAQQARKHEASLLLYELLGPDSDALSLRLDACRTPEQIHGFLVTAVNLIQQVRGDEDAELFRRAIQLPD